MKEIYEAVAFFYAAGEPDSPKSYEPSKSLEIDAFINRPPFACLKEE